MKRIGILSGMGSAVLAMLAHGGWPAEIAQGQRGSGKSRAAATVANHRFKNMGRPTAARWWHDLKDGAQLRAMEAAFAKRQRKAEKLQLNTYRSFMGNYAHHNAFAKLHDETQFIAPARLNPFHVAH